MLNLRNDKAFEVFLRDHIQVISDRKDGNDHGLSVRCCINHKTFDEPLDDNAPSSTRLVISVTIPRYGTDGWDDYTLNSSPRKGDIVVLDDLQRFAVTDVSKDEQFYFLNCREISSVEAVQ